VLTELVGLREPAIIKAVGLEDSVGLGESVGVIDPDELGDRDPDELGNREPVGLGDRDTVGLGERELVGLTVIDPIGLPDSVGLALPVGDKGTRAYEIENTGLPPAPAIGTAVGKTIVKVEFC
jgi:hypothetical protein